MRAVSRVRTDHIDIDELDPLRGFAQSVIRVGVNKFFQFIESFLPGVKRIVSGC